MKTAIISVTEKGRILSEKIKRSLYPSHQVSRYTFIKHTDKTSESFEELSELVSKIFGQYDAIVFVCACAIAVRTIAPHIVSKLTDPAVIAVDDCGRFVIPVLSGHIGKANALAVLISDITGGRAAVTTATDTGGRFSPDSFAVANKLLINDMNAAKEIAAAVLDGEKTGFYTEYPYKKLHPDISYSPDCRTGIVVADSSDIKPFKITLNLIPKNIVLGIGCRKGTDVNSIMKHVSNVFSAAGISKDRICAVATIDIKAEEDGLVRFCRQLGIPLYCYSADELMRVKGNFEASEFVMKTTGADNVCERSAVLCSGGNLIIKKSASGGITAAAAVKDIELDFERMVL